MKLVLEQTFYIAWMYNISTVAKLSTGPFTGLTLHTLFKYHQNLLIPFLKPGHSAIAAIAPFLSFSR